MLSLLHTADLHLGARFPGLGEVEEERRRDFLATFRRLIDVALERRVDLFVVSGDLFDVPRPESGLVSFVAGQLERLVQAGILPVLLPGTHDWQTGRSGPYNSERLPGAVLLVSSGVTEVRVGETRVWLYAAIPQGKDASSLATTMRRRPGQGIHVGLLHGSLVGNPEWDYRSRDLPFSCSDLVGWDLDYVALGHYHRYQTLEAGGRLLACYPGSPEGKRFGEDGPRYGLLVRVGHRTAAVEPIEVQQRQLRQESLELAADLDDMAIAALICERAGGRDLVRLTLEGTLDRVLDLDALRQRCLPSCFYLDLVDRTRWFRLDRLDRLAREESVRGEVIRRFQRLRDNAAEEADRAEIDQALREILVRFHSREEL